MISWLESKLAAQYSHFVSSDKLIAVAGTLNQRLTAIACKDILVVKQPEVISSSDLPTPDLSKTLIKVGPKVKKAIFEVAGGHFGQMEQTLKLFSPEVALIVGVDQTNAELAGSLEQILEENAKLLARLPQKGAAILNWDDIVVRKLAQNTQAEVIFFGTDQKNCHLWAGNIGLDHNKLSFELNYGVERVEISSQFLGKHQIYPLLAAASLGLREGLRLTQIKKALESVYPLEHQLTFYSGFNNSLILDETQLVSPNLAQEDLEVVNYLPARRRVLVFGEIKHLGAFSAQIHRQIARKIYKEKLDLVFLVKGESQIVADELLKLGFLAERLEQELTNPQIVANLLKILAKGDLVLVMGAKELRLDEVVSKITKKA